MNAKLAGWEHDLRELERKASALRASIRREREELIRGTPEGKYASSYLSFNGVHSCKTTPIGSCVYDGFEDPSHDECLYCGDPYERK